MERNINASMWPDLSGGRLSLELLDGDQMLCFMFRLPELTCDVIDRHRKAPVDDKDAAACHVFGKCYLSVAEYRLPGDPYKLQEMGLKGAFDKLESLLHSEGYQFTESPEHKRRN